MFITKSGKEAIKLSVAVFGGLCAAALIASGSATAAQPDKFKACLTEANEACKKAHNPLDDADGFIKCLEEKYEEMKCESKTKTRKGQAMPMAEEPYNPLDDLPKFPEKLL